MTNITVANDFLAVGVNGGISEDPTTRLQRRNISLSASQYFSLRNITFSMGSAINGVTLTNGASILEFTGCTFTSAPATGLTSSNQAAVAVNTNSVTNYVSVTNCAFNFCRQAVNLAGSHIQVWGNTATTLYENFAQVSWAQGSPVIGLDISFNTAIGLVQIAPTHDDFIILFSSATSGVSSNFIIVGNVFACGGQVGVNSTGQGIFNKFGTQPSTASITGMVVAGNFCLTTALGGIPVDQLDSAGLIEGNTVVTDSSYSVANPSAIRVASSNGPAVKYNATVAGVLDTTPITPSVLTGNVTIASDALGDYRTAFFNPQLGANNTSLAQILTNWALKAGGPLDLTPKVGALGTGYVDYVRRTTAFPY